MDRIAITRRRLFALAAAAAAVAAGLVPGRAARLPTRKLPRWIGHT